jgi:predicted aspartyl protease
MTTMHSEIAYDQVALIGALYKKLDPTGRLRQASDIVVTGRYEDDTEVGSFIKVVDCRSFHSRWDYDRNGLQSSSGNDGQCAWTADENNQVTLRRSDRVVKYKAFLSAMCDLLFLAHPERFTICEESTGNERVLRISSRETVSDERLAATAVVDAGAMLIRELRVDSAVDELVIIIHEYGAFDGVLFPVTLELLQTTGVSTTNTISGVAIDRQPNGYSFAPPVVKPRYSVFSGESRIRLTMPHNHVHLMVRVAGRDCDFVLDTGAQRTTLDAALASELGCQTIGKSLCEGMGGTQAVADVRLAELVVGDAVYRDYIVAAMDLTGIRFGLPTVDGILGLDILRDFVMQLDLADDELVLTARAEAPVSRDGVEITLEGNSLPIEVDGLTGMAMMDTGSYLSTLQSSAAKRLFPTETSSENNGTENRGVGRGATATVDVVCQRIEIGGSALQQVPCRASLATAGPLSRTGRVAVIGGSVWRQFRMTIDFFNERAWLAPSRQHGIPISYRPTGVRLGWRDGRAIVMGLVAGLPASEAGVEVGDEIVAVNGEPIRKNQFESVRKLVESLPGGTVVLCVVREGGVVSRLTIRAA